MLSPVRAQQPALKRWLEAYDAVEIESFLDLAFPPHWIGIRARILESGATFADAGGPWAPRWTPIGRTERVGRADDETRMRSIFYRVHDCLHQLWGLPHPGDVSDEEDARFYKKAVMCGEVVVLTLTEFVFARWVHTQFPELREWIDGRCAVPMTRSVLASRSPTQIALRLDELLHKNWVARWAREDEESSAWVAYYTPMLAKDRAFADACWAAMREDPSALLGWLRAAPRARFSRTMTGQELTCWMMADFEHLLWSSPMPDAGLMAFNRERRSRIVLPANWPGGED